MSDIVKKDDTSLDNFAGWEEGIEGDDRPASAGVIQGKLVKFSNDAKWIDRDGNEIPGELELVAAGVVRLVQKWEDQKPVETIFIQPHQKFPDVEAMNEKIPRKEWVEGPDKKLRGPWQAQHVLYLVDLKTMDKYTYPTSTTGGRVAIRDLRDKIVWMQKFKGSQVFPVVVFAKAWMNTKFGGRWRPSFTIRKWVRLGGGDKPVEALPSPTPPVVQQPEQPAKPAQQTKSDLPLVEEPTLAEEMGDEIPFNDPTPDLGRTPAPNPKTTARRDLKKAQKKPGAKPPAKKQTVLDTG
jgi:hypothetical protein